MFDKKRYITNHANAVLPMPLQISMWKCIDKWRASNIQLDYLQVFKLSIENHDGKLIQKIEHSQEILKKKEVIYVECNCFEPITDKVYIIDDGDYSTMLMASDY